MEGVLNRDMATAGEYL